MLESVWRMMLLLWLTSIVIVISLPWSKFDAALHWENAQLIPFVHFNLHPTVLIETLLNVLAFVPVGYLAVRSVSTSRRRQILVALVVGMSSSIGVECYQLFCQERVASITDIIMNVTGTSIGIWLAFAVDHLFSFCAVQVRRLTA